jgi:hypothetical protein
MADAERGSIPVRALLAAKSLAPALRARIAAADADGNGSLSPDEVLGVLRSELALASERRVLRRVAAVLVAGLVLAVAAVAGLTFAVVALSKDTASSGGELVDKASGVPLATGAARGLQELSGLWQGADDTSMSLAGLTEFYTNGTDGVRRMWRVAGVEVAAGKWARVNTTEPGVSLYIDAAGASLQGVPAEQADDDANLQALCAPGIGDACIAGRLKKELGCGDKSCTSWRCCNTGACCPGTCNCRACQCCIKGYQLGCDNCDYWNNGGKMDDYTCPLDATPTPTPTLPDAKAACCDGNPYCVWDDICGCGGCD